MRFDTDYLVVGAGASGLAFADALVAEADVEVTVIDRRAAPGGHWVHAYPFVRLHTPSAYYGVNSLALGEDRIDQAGENAGYYERATGEEVCEYFAEAAARLAETGRVRVLTGHEHLGGGSDGEQVRDLSTGELHDVAVRRKVVDARYLEASIPATHAAPVSRWHRAHGSSRSTTCRRRRNQLPPTPSSAPARRPRTHASGFLTTAWSRIGFAGSGPATRGSMTAATFSRWSRSARSWRGSPSMPRPAPRRRASRTSSSGSRLRGGWCASTRRGRRRCTAARCSVHRELEALRQIDRCRQARPGAADRGRPDRARARGEPDRPRRPARRLHGARPEQRSRHADLPARSDRAAAGTAPLAVASTQPSSASSRPTGTTTRTRTGSAHPTPIRAASRTGRA